MLRVVHATAGAVGYNGVMRAVSSLSAALREYEGIDSVVLARPGRGRPPPGVIVYPCALRVLDSCVSHAAPRLALRLSRGGVLHVHVSKPPSESVLAAALAAGLRPVATVHAVPYKYRGPARAASAAYAGLLSLLLGSPRLRAVTVPSTGFLEEHRRVVGEAVVVPHAGGPAPGERVGPPPIASKPAPFTVAFIGRLSGEKGFHALAAAAARAARRLGGRLGLVVAGDGPLARLRGLLERRLGGRLAWLGWVGQGAVYGLLSSGLVDLVAAPSLSEAFSFTVADAVYYGVPVVASDIGAHRDLLGPGYPGLVPPGDYRALEDAIARAAEGGLGELERGVAAARARLPSWRSVARVYAGIYGAGGP